MKDFREQLREPPEPTLDRARELLRAGQFLKAMRLARRLGAAPESLNPELSAAAKRMFHGGRCGELMVAVGEFSVPLPYDLASLIHQAQASGDHHAVVKNAIKLGVDREFHTEVNASIEAIAKSAPLEAAAWRRKIDARSDSSPG